MIKQAQFISLLKSNSFNKKYLAGFLTIRKIQPAILELRYEAEVYKKYSLQ